LPLKLASSEPCDTASATPYLRLGRAAGEKVTESVGGVACC
jgi:hypothetical protein